MVFILVTALCGCSGAAPAKDGMLTITIENQTDWEFQEIYLIASEEGDWGINRLTDTDVLEAKAKTNVRFPAVEVGTYDLNMVDEDGDSWCFYDMTLQNNASVAISETSSDYIATIQIPGGETKEIIGSLVMYDDTSDVSYLGDVTSETIECQARANNHSPFAIYGEWRYGSVYGSDRYYVVREKTADGSGAVVLDDRGMATDILVLSDAVMFYNLKTADGAENGIYQCATDGSGRKQVATGDISGMQLYEGKLYFTGEAYENKLLCQDPAGEEPVTVLDSPMAFPFIFNEIVLYQAADDGQTLHLYDLDGENDFKISDDIAWNPVYDGEYIYYLNGSDNWAVYRVLPDGSYNEMLCDIPALSLTNVNGTLYFAGRDDYKIYRLSPDESEATVLSDKAFLMTDSLSVTDGRLYFFQGDASQGLYVVSNMDTGEIAPAITMPAPAPTPAPTPVPTPAPTPVPAPQPDTYAGDGYGDYTEDEWDYYYDYEDRWDYDYYDDDWDYYYDYEDRWDYDYYDDYDYYY